MLAIRMPSPVKLICGVIYSKEEVYQRVKEILQRKFGEIDLESEKIDFYFTDYYDKEMGAPLYRKFISFRRLKDATILVGIKLFCIKVERKLSKDGHRQINIDPGYLNDAKFVLATTKDYAHRIYLGKGIYAEVTLRYGNGIFYDFPTTYPDYCSPQYKKVLLAVRKIYHEQAKDLSRK
ncbi:MAG: DUF4416 family protein [Candidatus Omnitrophota bacterium]|nr:DUF4416 family protein [Candidatus Omnitrophota bacterium]